MLSVLTSRIGLLVALLVSLLALSCSGKDKEVEQTPHGSVLPIQTTAVAAEALIGTPTPGSVDWRDLFDQKRPSDSDTPAAEPSAGFPAVHLQPMFGGQTFDRMTGLYEDSTGAWYVTEQPGRVQRMASSKAPATLWLDLTDRVDDDHNEKGLTGFVLSPDFETSGVFYVAYAAKKQNILSRFRTNGSVADAASEQQLLTTAQPGKIHNLGQLAFGPDGFLYVGSGDGGLGEDFLNFSQNRSILLGKILRLDVSDVSAPYRVPADNPFAGRADARGEIWAYGFRNPWRFSFDRATGDLWAGDVGNFTREEIDLVQRGGNYGWRITEGSGCRDDVIGCNTTGLLPPVYDYLHSASRCAVVGGFVYRGSAIPELQGAYVFSDLCSGAIMALRVVNGVLQGPTEIASTGMLVSSFAEGRDGELYVLELATKGRIFRIVP